MNGILHPGLYLSLLATAGAVSMHAQGPCDGTASSAQTAQKVPVESSTYLDPVLHRRWMIARDTKHPEYPGRFVAGRLPAVVTTAKRPRVESGTPVQAGSMIVLRSCVGGASIQLSATALEGGLPGDVIRLHTAFGDKILRGRLQEDGAAQLVTKAVAMHEGDAW